MQEQAQQTAQPAEAEVYLDRCDFCGGQFPTYRAICEECEDAAEADGFRDGKKVTWRDRVTVPTTAQALA